jgi:integrase
MLLSCFLKYNPYMESKSVTLMVRFKDTDGKWKRRPAARGANGRVKPGHALVDGKAVAVKDGAYELRHFVDRQPVYLPAGKNAAAADVKRQQLEIKSSVKAQAKQAGIEVVEAPEGKSLKATAAAYIDNALKRGANEAAAQARLVTNEFLRLVKLTNVDEVTQDHIFQYHNWIRKNQCSDRTVSNKHMRLASWLRFGGIDPKQIPPKPRYEEKLPDVYTSEQTHALLAGASPYMRMCILLGLKCGLRDQELRNVEFRDINWESKTLRVRAKPQWKFTVKTWEQREVPVPVDVLDALREWQEKRSGQTLILGTKNRKPNSKLLLMLKHVAKRAGLNCGRCDSCLKRKECEEFTLHRLRRTYLTMMLRGGVDLRSVQAYAGHRLIETTMRYLAPEAAPDAQAKVNSIKW